MLLHCRRGSARTNETSTNIGARLFPTSISPEPRLQPAILPCEPPGQATAISRGSCRGRALRGPRMLHPVSPKSFHVHPYPRGPPAYEATLPAQIGCRKTRSKWVGVAAQYETTLETYSSSCKIHGNGGNASDLFDLIALSTASPFFFPFQVPSVFQCLLAGVKTHPDLSRVS